jgi:hypothetical protein
LKSQTTIMDFRTIIPIKKTQNPIDYNSQLLLMGSCFAENMGKKFEYFKFQAKVNPFGIIFNPVSIEKLLDRVVNQKPFTDKDVFLQNDLWHCFEVHSELSNPNKEALLIHLNELLNQTHFQISKLTHFQITYGTSWVYRHKLSNEIVANCHKMPQKEFEKELLSVDQIQSSIQNTIALVQTINPACHFIFTISPVRHTKDGFIENQQSKAHLITALHASSSQFPTSNYFPSYEIMMDELRDYRFYAEDMLHPNQTAIDYIWICFFENYIDEKEFKTMQEVCDVQKALRHKPFNPESESHQKFLKNLDLKILKIRQSLPHLEF